MKHAKILFALATMTLAVGCFGNDIPPETKPYRVSPWDTLPQHSKVIVREVVPIENSDLVLVIARDAQAEFDYVSAMTSRTAAPQVGDEVEIKLLDIFDHYNVYRDAKGNIPYYGPGGVSARIIVKKK